MTEFERFKSIYSQQSIHTLDYLEMLNPEQWQAIPHDSEMLYLGTRVNKITVSALVKHFIVAERHWINSVATMPTGSVIPIPANTSTLDDLDNGEKLLDAYRKAHEENLKLLSGLSDDDLKKDFVLAGRHYTGMGILWAMFSHHAYHLGQIDLIIRQLNLLAPEYMEWPETEKNVA